MPRYRTISRWYDRATGKYVDPPTIVELDEATGARLIRARCVEALPDPEPIPTPSTLEPPTGSPEAEIQEGKKPSLRRKPAKAG